MAMPTSEKTNCMPKFFSVPSGGFWKLCSQDSVRAGTHRNTSPRRCLGFRGREDEQDPSEGLAVAAGLRPGVVEEAFSRIRFC
jgi:hypothetical protein